MEFASKAPVTAADKHKTDKAPAPAISTVHLTIIGIFIPIILVAINATTAPIIIENIKPNTGPNMLNCGYIRPTARPAKEPIIPIDNVM